MSGVERAELRGNDGHRQGRARRRRGGHVDGTAPDPAASILRHTPSSHASASSPSSGGTESKPCARRRVEERGARCVPVVGVARMWSSNVPRASRRRGVEEGQLDAGRPGRERLGESLPPRPLDRGSGRPDAEAPGTLRCSHHPEDARKPVDDREVDGGEAEACSQEDVEAAGVAGSSSGRRAGRPDEHERVALEHLERRLHDRGHEARVAGEAAAGGVGDRSRARAPPAPGTQAPPAAAQPPPGSDQPSTQRSACRR
jgi:hypothetical protein